MGDPQAPEFPGEELASFLETFLEGLLTEGLTQPLERWAKGRKGAVANSARSWYALMASGKAPDSAIGLVTPQFPAPVGDLLVLGLQSGLLDHVVEDMLGALCAGNAQAELTGLLNEYRKRPPGTVTCEGCIAREFTRMAQRAEVEGAVEVHLRWDNSGFMEQRFFGPYVVTVRQPSRHAVVRAMANRLKRGGQVGPGLVCSSFAGAYFINCNGKELKAVLED